MFISHCQRTDAHAQHTYTRHWIKSELLPYLRNPENYLDEWDAIYTCPGIPEIDDDEYKGICIHCKQMCWLDDSDPDNIHWVHANQIAFHTHFATPY